MKRKLFFILSATIGIVIVALIFYFADIGRIFSQAKEIGFLGAGIFIVNAFLVILISSLSWRIILKSYGFSPPFKDVLSAKMIGSMVSYLTPSMYIGGEPLRAYIISKKHKLPMAKIGASVVVDKFLELGAGLFFIYLGSILALIEYKLPLRIYLTLLIVNVLFSLGMGLLLISFIFENRVFTKIATFIGRINILSKIIRKIIPHISEIENEIFLSFKQHRRETFIAFCLNLLAGFLIFLKPAIFFYFLEFIFRFSQLALVFALTHLILAFQFTPGALGIFELGTLGIYRIIGIGADKALAFTLMVRFTDLAGIAVAIFLIIRLGLLRFGSEKKE
jgi:uncharacterized protein (TIRG00374 family)